MSHRTPGGERWRLLGPSGRVREIRLDPYITVIDPVIAHELTVAGLGISMLPAFLTRYDQKRTRILPK